MVACVAGVWKGRGRELGHETTRAQIPPSSSPFNACHTGYLYGGRPGMVGGKHLPPNEQTSVNFRNFAELYLRSLKTYNHFQFWQFY